MSTHGYEPRSGGGNSGHRYAVLFFMMFGQTQIVLFFSQTCVGYQILVVLPKNRATMRTTSVALGAYFEHFIQTKVSQGRYNNASEVIRAGLRLLEAEENRFMALREALHEGLESGIAPDFDPQQHLRMLKAKRNNG